MAGSSDEEMESVLSNFDEIYNDFRDGVWQIQSLQSNCNAEIKKRQALQFSLNNLQSENERLTKLYTGSLNKMADQLERNTNCQSLKEELSRLSDERLRKDHEHMNTLEMLKQGYMGRINDLEAQIRGYVAQKTANEATIVQLHQDLAAHRNHIDALATRLERVHFEVESKYQSEIQDLKDCLSIEQEEKNELNKKLQDFEKELLISRTKLAEHQRDSTASRNVETLKQKIMKLRKENEVLKRQLSVLKDD